MRRVSGMGVMFYLTQQQFEKFLYIAPSSLDLRGVRGRRR